MGEKKCWRKTESKRREKGRKRWKMFLSKAGGNKKPISDSGLVSSKRGETRYAVEGHVTFGPRKVGCLIASARRRFPFSKYFIFFLFSPFWDLI